jgi:catechol 2,3-dioxygenase
MNSVARRWSASPALGPVELSVADLDRSSRYYRSSLGMELIAREGPRARFGLADRTMLVLTEIPGAKPAPASSHFALDVPTRADLARFARHHRDGDLRDHLVSESCYVLDPDGHRIEITWGRPRDEWSWQNGLPLLAAGPLSLDDFTGDPFDGLAPATTLGHVQLKVTDRDLAATEPFYCDLLGLDVTARVGDSFLGVGASDFRTLLVFTSRFSVDGAEPAPPRSAGLIAVNLTVPEQDDLDALAQRLVAAGHPHTATPGALTVQDPSGNLLRFSVDSGPTVTAFLRSMDFLQDGALDQWLALFDDHAVLEFPFAPPGSPSRVEGKAALADHVKARAKRMPSPKVEQLHIHVTEDPSTIVAEMTIRGATDRTRRAIAVVTVHNGLITLYRDYWNPLDLAAR